MGGVLIAVMAWTTIRDRRRGSGGLGQVVSGLGQVLRNPQTWLIALAGLGTNGTLLGFGGLWGVPFMGAAQGLEPATAAFVTSLIIAGWGCGAPVFGMLSDRMRRRRTPFLIGYAICAPSFLTLIYGPSLPIEAVAALTFLTGFGGAAQIVCFASVRELNAPAQSGTAIGVVNAFVTGTGAIYQPLIGWLLDRSWSGKLAGGARLYDAADYRLAFAVLVAGLGIGLICTFLMRETRCQPQVA